MTESTKEFIVNLAERCEHAQSRAIEFVWLDDLETCAMYSLEAKRLALVAFEVAA